MKKVLLVILCIVMMLSVCPLAFAADDGVSDYPYIIVPGYSSAQLYRIDENGEKVHVWGVVMDEIVQALLQNIAKVGIGLGGVAQGNAKYIAKVVGNEFIRLYSDMACNPDGTSVYPLQRYCVTAEESCSAKLMEEYPDGYMQHERFIMGEVAESVGYENIFNFNSDFRMGAVACAKQLDEFIQSVKEYTGKDKVNILAVSHGGQVTGTYLTLYGQKGDVNNAVLTVPALGGAGFAYDAMSAQIDFDEEGLLRFIEHGEMEETDYNWLVRAQQLGFLDNVFVELIPYVMQIMGYWGSMWDFVPTEYYEELKAQRLDEQESALLIEKSDYMHYQVMPEFANGFKRAQEAGTNVSIIAGYGNMIITGLKESSDSIITIAASTGATVAPLGQRFADGYTQKVDTGFYQVSPSMTIDASTSYLPKNTWFVENLYHGMTYKDEYTSRLMLTLLMTDKIKDVHSDPNYPQFHATTNVSHSVFAAFDKSNEGYLSSDDTALVVKNLSQKYDMNILAVSTRGIDLKFSGYAGKTLKPGESITLTFKGDIPEVSSKNFDLVIDYTLSGSATPMGERLLNFTVMNGEPAAYDSENPYVKADIASGGDSLFREDIDNILEKVGVKPLLTMIYDIVMTWFGDLFKFIIKIVNK
ncbi:MAG: esterase/lipase family protein [Acutalibacteraceae bacterium]